MKFIKFTIYTLIFLVSLGFVNHASAATEFVSVVDTGNGTGTDYTSLNAWETGVQTDLTAATTLVFAGTKTGTMADNASVTGASSLATATIVHVTSTQILLENISGTFQNGEQIQIDGSNYFTTSNVGDSAIAVAKCRASTGVADTTAVVIDGWTTSATNYIKVWTDPSEAYRHEGKLDERKYRIAMFGTWQNAVSSYEEYTKIEGLQVGVINPTSNSGGGIKINTNNHTIFSNLIWGVMGLGAPMGISAGSLSNVYIYNNIIYGFNKSSDESLGTGIYVPDSTAYVYNNTVVDCGYGIYGANSIPIAKNNIAYNNEDNYYYGFDAASTNNLSGPTQADAPGSNPQNGVNLTFAEEANDDFHLAQSDVGAKNVGADLSADANLPFFTDIDGSTRTGTWDIGADEAAIQVFYSVGQNTDDHKTGSPNLTIASGVGTFSVAQTATNMGVGDKVTYDTSTVAYISEKISTTEWKLITATGGTPANITDSTVVSIAHPFASLSAALPSSPGGSKGASYLNTADLVTGNYQLNIPCYYDTGADTTAVDINGWTTGAANYIKVYTPNNTTTEVNQSQRHSGKWDEGKYKMEYSGAPGITIQTDDVRIDGLQLYLTSGGQNDGGIFTRNSNANSDFRFSNNIIKAPGNLGSIWMDGIQIYLSGSGNVYIWNNIIYGFGPNINDNGILIDDSDFTAYIYNNTIYNCTNGIYRYAGTAVAKNNIAYNNTTNYLYYSTPFDPSSTNNLSGPTQTDAPGSNPQNSKTVISADEANDDFHLVLEDTGARSYGINLFADAYLPVKDDIDGQTRGEPWDIGADQYQGAVGNSERNLPTNLESGLIGYWSFDSPDTTWTSDTTGTTDDLSGNNYDGTLTNMLKASSPIGGISGQGFDFRGQDATADNVSVTHSTAFDSVDITYSAWIKPDTISNWNAITEVTPTQDYFGLYNGQYSIWGRCGNVYLGHTIARNQWAFVAYVISGENYSLYEDGELIASGSGCSTSTTGHGLLKIGARSDDSMGFDGVIDEVRVYSRALSIDEVVQLYKLNAGKMQPNSVLSKTAGLASGLVGHWSFDGPDTAWTSSTAGTTDDLSGNSNTGTMTNMSRSASPVFGKLGQAFNFDGTDDYVDAGDINAIDGISQMTISTWFYRPSSADTFALEKGPSSINRAGINVGSGNIWFNIANGENASGYISCDNTGWFHSVLVFDGTQTGNANRLKGYVNGVAQTLNWWNSYDIPATTPSNSASFLVGRSVGNNIYAKGKIDDVRIYDRVLSSDEVADLYQTGQMKILK